VVGGSGWNRTFPRLRGYFFLAGLDGEREAILFPDDAVFRPDNTISSSKARFYTLRPAESVGADGMYFVARAIGGRRSRIPPASLAAAEAAADANMSHDAFLFRWRGGDALELVQNSPVIAVDAQRSGDGYVVMTRVPPGYNSSPVDFHVVRNGAAERRLRFELVGTAYAVSVSERLDTIVFPSFRNPGEQVRFWLHREGMAQAEDLNIAERVRREVGIQIQRGGSEAAGEQAVLPTTPPPPRPAAAPR